MTMPCHKLFLVLCALQFVSLCQGAERPTQNRPLQEELKAQLPVLGHRNWIVIADMAYPAQVSPGIKTVYVGGDQLTAIRDVLDVIEKSPHVRPVIRLDEELEAVSEKDAPGIEAFRAELSELLATKDTTRLLHEEIIERLDNAGQTFQVIVLKTDCTLPYTSVFIQLECGYWSDAAEQRLRESLR